MRNFVEPVGIGQSHRLLGIDISVVSSVYGICVVAIGSRIICLDGASGGSIEVQTVVAGISHGVDAVIKGSLSHGGCIFSGVAELHHRLRVVELSRKIC